MRPSRGFSGAVEDGAIGEAADIIETDFDAGVNDRTFAKGGVLDAEAGFAPFDSGVEGLVAESGNAFGGESGGGFGGGGGAAVISALFEEDERTGTEGEEEDRDENRLHGREHRGAGRLLSSYPATRWSGELQGGGASGGV